MTMKIELELIPVSERLPDEDGRYLCLMSYGHIETYAFSLKYNAFNTHDHHTPAEANDYAIRTMTHWAKLPDLSKAKEEPRKGPIAAGIELYEKKQQAYTQEAIQQRRREMFERVAMATIEIDDGEPSWEPEIAKKITEDILATADKFARGE